MTFVYFLGIVSYSLAIQVLRFLYVLPSLLQRWTWLLTIPD